jgi:hypothetical protein
MLDLAFRDLSFPRLGSALVGGVVLPSVLTVGSVNAQPIVGQPLFVTEPTFSDADSVTLQVWNGDPDSGGTAISGATSLAWTPTDTEYAATLYIRWTATNDNGYVTFTAASSVVVGKVFSDDFSVQTAGDNTATFLADGWTRSGTGIEALIATEAQAPTSGKALTWWGTPNSLRHFYRNDWDIFSNAHGTDDYEELFLYKHQTAAGRFVLRPHNGAAAVHTTVGPGFAIRLGVLYAQLPGEDPNDPAAAGSTNLGPLTVGTSYWLRKRSVGAVAYYKKWELGDPEPASWGAIRTHSAAMTNRGPSISYRAGTASDIQRLLFVSSGHRAPAPYPVGYEAPIGESSDPMTYAASASATSFAQNDGAITYTFGDV